MGRLGQTESPGRRHQWPGKYAEGPDRTIGRRKPRQADDQAVERFRAKACPGLDPGWIPVRVKKTRQNKNLEPRSDSIGTEEALECNAGWTRCVAWARLIAETT